MDGARGKVERGGWCGAAVGVENGPGEGEGGDWDGRLGWFDGSEDCCYGGLRGLCGVVVGVVKRDRRRKVGWQ